ncbi:hypothetical protein JX266_014238 [Neoarthrinium moseri]|nr:hypothetical protein JX266_014238 [Neoarthrinium moseri]
MPGSDFHKNGIFREIAKGANSPGQTIVVSCGEASFTGSIRNEVIKNSSMQFAEVEYRPTYSSHDPSEGLRAIPLKRLQRRHTRTSDPEGQALARGEYGSPE